MTSTAAHKAANMARTDAQRTPEMKYELIVPKQRTYTINGMSMQRPYGQALLGD